VSILKRIRKTVREGRVKFSDHALQEMAADYLLSDEVFDVLLHGALYKRHENDPQGIQYLIRGATDDDLDVEVVCRILASGILFIITVYRITDLEEDDE
jgi:hypothetical protein